MHKIFSQLMATYVFYHLPSDRDDPDHPNAYQINKNVDDVTLQDVRENFPLPGKYHFRFKVRLGDSNNSYWLDVNDDSKIVPALGPRRIVAKVLRLSWDGHVNQKRQSPSLSSVKPNVPLHTVADSIDLFTSNKSGTHHTSMPSAPKTSVGDLDLFG
jgi:hypothetical protein